MVARLILLAALALGIARAQIGWEVEFGKIYCGYLQNDGYFTGVGGREDMMQDDKVWRWTLDDTDSAPFHNVKDCSGKCKDTGDFCVNNSDCPGSKNTCKKGKRQKYCSGTWTPCTGPEDPACNIEGKQRKCEKRKYAGILEFKTAAVVSDTDRRTVMEPLDTSLKTIYQIRTEMKEIYIRLLEARKSDPNCKKKETRGSSAACLVYDTPLGRLDRGNEAALRDVVTKSTTGGKWICSLSCDSGINLFDNQASFQVTSNVKMSLLAGTDEDVTGENSEYALKMTQMPHEKASAPEVVKIADEAERQDLIPASTTKAEFSRYLGIWWSYAGYEQGENPDKNRTPYYKDGIWHKVLRFERIFGDETNRIELQKICEGFDLELCYFYDVDEDGIAEPGITEADEPQYAVVEERLARSSCAQAADPEGDRQPAQADHALHVKKCFEQLHPEAEGLAGAFKPGTRNEALDAATYMTDMPEGGVEGFTVNYDMDRNHRMVEAKKYMSEIELMRANLRSAKPRNRNQQPLVAPDVNLNREKPKVEKPKVEEPKVEKPKVEEPKVEKPKLEKPKLEEPVESEPHHRPQLRSVSRPQSREVSAKCQECMNCVADGEKRYRRFDGKCEEGLVGGLKSCGDLC